jgi:hypothetical protein
MTGVTGGRALEEETKPAEIVRQIQGEIEEWNGEAVGGLKEVAAQGAIDARPGGGHASRAVGEERKA